MQHFKVIALTSVGIVALSIAPLARVSAEPHHGGGRGFHHFGIGGAVASAIIGVVTLPFAIAAAVADSMETSRYEPPAPAYYPPPSYYGPPAYYPPPAAYYGRVPGYAAPTPRAYYPRPAGYYPPRPLYNSYSTYHSIPRQGYYPYRR